METVKRLSFPFISFTCLTIIPSWIRNPKFIDLMIHGLRFIILCLYSWGICFNWIIRNQMRLRVSRLNSCSVISGLGWINRVGWSSISFLLSLLGYRSSRCTATHSKEWNNILNDHLWYFDTEFKLNYYLNICHYHFKEKECPD